MIGAPHAASRGGSQAGRKPGPRKSRRAWDGEEGISHLVAVALASEQAEASSPGDLFEDSMSSRQAQCSTISPSATRQRWMKVHAAGRPDGGMPASSGMQHETPDVFRPEVTRAAYLLCAALVARNR